MRTGTVPVTRHGPFAGALAKVPVRDQAESQEICVLRRATVPLAPAAQALATMLASYLRTVRGR
ncbi:hypothetical protein [Burkholderia sp. IMCC1007]|uniref:hypothetical protein n=1 Tax=Burkholderia sp. IMCC1007 TaxID=3004104 RepID=UPI0022B4A922|nr:hypothetical protein [Burkholderia sp. IMCC1007]